MLTSPSSKRHRGVPAPFVLVEKSLLHIASASREVLDPHEYYHRKLGEVLAMAKSWKEWLRVEELWTRPEQDISADC